MTKMSGTNVKATTHSTAGRRRTYLKTAPYSPGLTCFAFIAGSRSPTLARTVQPGPFEGSAALPSRAGASGDAESDIRARDRRRKPTAASGDTDHANEAW